MHGTMNVKLNLLLRVEIDRTDIRPLQANSSRIHPNTFANLEDVHADGQLSPCYELILCPWPPLSAPEYVVLFTSKTNKEDENKNKFSKANVNVKKEDGQLEIEEKKKNFMKRKGKENKRCE